MDPKKFPDPAHSEQKKAYRFNIIDFALMLVIVAAVAILAYIMIGDNTVFMGDEDGMVLYTIEIPSIKNEFISSFLLAKGSTIIDSVRTNELGIIQDIQITECIELTNDLAAGVVREKVRDGFSRVIITILAKCKKDGVKFSVNGLTIMVGMQLSFRTPYLIHYGNCTSLVEVDEEGNIINE